MFNKLTLGASFCLLLDPPKSRELRLVRADGGAALCSFGGLAGAALDLEDVAAC